MAGQLFYLFVHFEGMKYNWKNVVTTFKAFFASQRQGRISFYVTTTGEEVGTYGGINGNIINQVITTMGSYLLEHYKLLLIPPPC